MYLRDRVNGVKDIGIKTHIFGTSETLIIHFLGTESLSSIHYGIPLTPFTFLRLQQRISFFFHAGDTFEA